MRKQLWGKLSRRILISIVRMGQHSTCTHIPIHSVTPTKGECITQYVIHKSVSFLEQKNWKNIIILVLKLIWQ